MEENIITWNVPNWVTIVLMATLGFAILSVIATLVRSRMEPSADSMEAA